MDVAGSSSSGSKWSKYVSPLSADKMVNLATSLLADPYLRHKIQNIQTHDVSARVWSDKEEIPKVEREVHAACPHLSAACATGVALALLPLSRSRSVVGEDVTDLFVKCDGAGEEAVAAFYAAMERPACTVTDLTIQGAAFGTPSAAAHLGRCLSVKFSIRELTIENVHGFCDEAVWSAFSRALASNATLRVLRLRGGSYRPGNSSHVGATLGDSHKLSALEEFSAGDYEVETSFEGWGNMLKLNSCITRLELKFKLVQGCELLVPLCKGLCANSTLRKLIIGRAGTPQPPECAHVDEVTSTDMDAGSLATMLCTNQSLTLLDIMSSGIVCNACVFVEGLSQNCTLEELHIRVDAAGAEALMAALTSTSVGDTSSSAGGYLKSLWLGDYSQVSQCFPTSHALGRMLASNKSLTALSLNNAPYNKQEWAATIVPALENNHSLQQLYLHHCRGVDGGLVFDAILELLESNTSISKISLGDTPLSREGKAQLVQARVNANKEYGAVLKNVPTIATTSCRLVLCGYPLAGKSTLLQTMIRRHSCDHHVATKTGRTRGIDIRPLAIDDLTMWVWDFAGHREFHPLLDFIFPNASSAHAATAFIFTFNPMLSGNCRKGKRQFEQEFSYWLKFIRSNAKQRPSSRYKPLVLIVVTHKDKLKSKGTNLMDWFREWVRDVAKTFDDMVEFDAANLFFMDATDEHDPALHNFVQYALDLLRQRILDLPKVPAICDSIAKALGVGSAGQKLEPIISLVNFRKLCESVVGASTGGNYAQQQALTKLLKGTKDKASTVIAAYLRDAGEVLYYSDLDFLVRNPRWFAHGILGHLIDLLTPNDSDDSSKGLPDSGTSFLQSLLWSLVELCCPRVGRGEPNEVSREDDMWKDANGLVNKALLEKLLQKAIETVGLNPHGTNTDQLIQLMEKLDLCYKTDEKYLLPALLKDEDGKAERGECKREWDFNLPSSTPIFVSRRLQCLDPLRTFITPGFFPRLQVVLHRKADEWKVSGGKPPCDLEKYFCRLRCNNGMVVLVEHSGSNDYFVDIMVKSYKSWEETDTFLKSKVIDEIRQLCASTKGCQGVTLVEGIIRPDCVGENIVLCRHRQSILVAVLEREKDDERYWEEVKDENGAVILPVAVRDSQHLLDAVLEDICECYPNLNVKKGKKRGLAVIISMEKERSGASEDRENLKALAQILDFDFEDHVMVDSSATEVIQALKTIAQEKILAEHECFVCFVNAHGDSTDDDSEEHYFIGQDNNLFLESIIRPFRLCEQLQNKPKVFFVNSCRGTNTVLADEQQCGTSEVVVDEQQGGTSEVLVDEQQCGTSEGLVDEQQCGTSVQQQPSTWKSTKEAIELKYVREIKDCLIVFSTSGRAVSIRNTQVGTSFVVALKNAFTKKRQMLHVLDIVIRATNEVAGKEVVYKNKAGDVATIGQCPVYVSSLTKQLYWR